MASGDLEMFEVKEGCRCLAVSRIERILAYTMDMDKWILEKSSRQ